MKKLIIAILVLISFITCLYLERNTITKTVISKIVQSTTGLDISIEKLYVKIIPMQIKANGIKLYNPSGLNDHLIATIAEIYIDYDLISSLKKELRIKDIRFNIKELFIVKTKEGEFNLTSLKLISNTKKEEGVKKPQITEEEQKIKEDKVIKLKESKEPRKIKIDKLYIKIGKIIYKDYTKGSLPKINEYVLNIEEKFENITDLRGFINLFALKTFISTSANKFIELDSKSTKDNMKEILKKETEISAENPQVVTEQVNGVTDEARENVKETLDQLEKKLEFPFDKLEISEPKSSGK